MKKKNLIIKNCIKKKYLKNKRFHSFSKNFEKIISDIKFKSNSPLEIYNLLNKNYKFNFKTSDLKIFKRFKSIAIIGMGGSILGTEAIYEFLKIKIKKKIYFFDNINSDKIKEFKAKTKLDKTLFLIISKSGNTIETISNFLFLGIIKKNSKNIILISEKKQNFIYTLAKNYNLFYIEHKNYIGGRYSVLSEVGLVPAYLMNLNIKKLRNKTQYYLTNSRKKILKDSSIKMAVLLKNRIFKNLVLINYVPQLEKFLYWSQQLIAESLGKKGYGFLPIISNTPKDHHSLLQLYLDGPRDKVFSIFSFDEKSSSIIKTNKYNLKFKYLNNKSLSQIKFAQKNALIECLKKNNIPFREFKIKKMTEDSLGELFAYFIIETIILGRLIGINPFDQPSVEQVKKTTKELLTKFSKNNF